MAIPCRTGKSRSEYRRKVLVILFCGLAGGCVVPNHMHVTEGNSPQNVDTNVRFRTTYYFRVFDYCWSSNAALGGGLYRKIIPETDTVYRYRMTGKASALGTRIKFESGILDAAVIDPFGTDVVFNADANGFLLRTPAETKAIADAAAKARDDQAARERAIENIRSLAATLPINDEATAKAVRDAINNSLAAVTGPATADLKPAIEQLQASVDALAEKVGKPAAAPDPAPPAGSNDAVLAAVAGLKTELENLRASLAPAQGEKPTACGVNEIRRSGFQVMGPQGMHAFDQDKRLLMAMSTSAKPLIETLNEYAGRILKGQRNPADLLLPLAEETTRIVETRRAVDGVAIRMAESPSAAASSDEVFAAAIAAFEREPK
jgi:hypothetical protein